MMIKRLNPFPDLWARKRKGEVKGQLAITSDNPVIFREEVINQLNLIVHILIEGAFQLSQLDEAIQKLNIDLAALTVANKAAIDALNAIPAKIQAAVDAALAAGATPDQLAALSALATTVEQDTADMVAATPVAPAPAPAPATDPAAP